MRPALALIAAVIGTAALTACGAAASHSHTGTTQKRRHAASTGGSTTTQAAAATTTTASSTPSRCLVSDLSLAPPVTDGAAGSIALHFTFTNISSAPCTLFGYPGLARLSATHLAIGMTVVRGTSVVVPSEPERTVVVAPGGTASFRAGYSDVPDSLGPCTHSSYLEVTPPNAYAHFTVPLAANICRKTITVSPVIAGS